MTLVLFVPRPATTSQNDFKWDWRRSEELSLRQSLRRAKVTKTERRALTRAIANELESQELNLDVESAEQLENFALDSRVKMVDLNGEGTPEAIVQGAGDQLCSPTGNCPFWIFQRANHSYRLILYEDSVQSFTVQRTRTAGFNDIVVAMHGSAFSSGLTLFKYGHGSYHDAGCYEASWSVLEGDEVHELKEPRIIPCSDHSGSTAQSKNGDK
jgi:hypothetical protein